MSLILRVSRYGLIAAIGLASAITAGTVISWAPAVFDALGSDDVSGVVAGTDFAMFYAAADLASDGAWEEAYSLEGLARSMDATVGGVSFAYPPPFAQLLIPFTGLDYPTALTVWMLVSLLAIALVPLVFGLRGAAALAALAFPVYIMLRFGQFGSLALLGLAGAAAAFQRGHYRIAWAASGLLLLKPQLLAGPVLVGPWLPDLRRRLFAGLGAAAAVIFTASVALAPTAWVDWLSGFADVSTPAVSTPWDFSLRTVTGALGGFGSVSIQVVAAVGIVYLGIAVGRRLDHPTEALAVGLIVSALISPRMVAYDWVILIPAFAWLAGRIWKDPALLFAATAVTLGSLSGLAHAGWAGWLSLFGFLVVLWVGTARPPAELRARSAA